MNHLDGIERLGARLWKVSDDLRANFGVASNEYFMPIMELLFLRLRQPSNPYYEALAGIEADKATGKMPDRDQVKADFRRRRAMMLSEATRYDTTLERPQDGALGAALTVAVVAMEARFPPPAGQLPKAYEPLEDNLLKRMLRTFDTEGFRAASGDVFGRIYEYFLAEFSKQRAHDNGEFFTPPAIVQTIVNDREPDHDIVLDPACGTGGMFVQSSHFSEDAGTDTMKRVTFYCHEKNETTAKLAETNPVVNGEERRIRTRYVAITYNNDPHELIGKCDFAIAKSPFNAGEVDAEKFMQGPHEGRESYDEFCLHQRGDCKKYLRTFSRAMTEGKRTYQRYLAF